MCVQLVCVQAVFLYLALQPQIEGGRVVLLFAPAGLPALQGGEPGQVRKEAAITIYCECRGKARHFFLLWRPFPAFDILVVAVAAVMRTAACFA